MNNYGVLPADILRDFYGISHFALRKKAERIGARKQRWQKWTEEEEKQLLAFGWPITRQLARTFNRSPGAVRDKLRELTYKTAAKAQK